MPGTSSNLRRAVVLCALSVLLAGGCQRAPVETPHAPTLPPLPAYPPAGAVRYVLDAAESDLRIVVYRGGPLAQFGHNHVLRAGDLRGEVYLASEFHRSAFALEFSPAGLIVDPPDARAAEGPDFASEPSPEAVAGTRDNLLGPRVLDVERFPLITLRSVALAGGEDTAVATVRVGLHGIERDLGFPVTVSRRTDRIVAEGTLRLSTPDFGIPSFTVMGGGLRVEEEVTIRFRIVAEKPEDRR